MTERSYKKGMGMSEEEIIGILRECTLFKGMGNKEISIVLTEHMGRIKSYTGGQLLVQAGEEVRFLHILLKGSVKGEMIDFTGKAVKIEDIDPPRPLAPAFLFGKENTYPVNITAAEDVEVISIPRDRFLIMLQESKQVLVNFINIISSRGQFLSSKIKFLSFTTIKGKLAQYLLDISAQTGKDNFALPYSQSQLSELFGVARPSIGRAISELNRDGIIRTEGKNLLIMDSDRLSGFLQ